MEQLLQSELIDLSAWLSQRLAVDAIASRVWRAGGLGAAYQWRGQSRDERFLLSLKVTPATLKIFHLWIPRSMRRQGLGTAIVAHLVLVCRRHGIPSLTVEPRPGSEGFWASVDFISVPGDSCTWCCNLGDVE